MVYLRLHYLLALFLFLPLFSCSGGGVDSTSDVSNLSFGELGLTWVAPSEREDGSVLSPSEIQAYRIYYGSESGNYSNVVDIYDHVSTQADVTNIPSGNYFVVMTTVDVNGRESAFSTPEIEVAF